MSLLAPGDERWHYSDGSHRWACPEPDGDQETWADRVRAHVARHSEGQDTPPAMMTPLSSPPETPRAG